MTLKPTKTNGLVNWLVRNEAIRKLQIYGFQKFYLYIILRFLVHQLYPHLVKPTFGVLFLKYLYAIII
jgi:hypothetical protein